MVPLFWTVELKRNAPVFVPITPVDVTAPKFIVADVEVTTPRAVDVT